MKQDTTQEQIVDLLEKTKTYYNLQKEYLKLTVAEQMTMLLSKLAIVLIAGVVFSVVLLFIGLALVHLLNLAIGNIGICYGIFALFMVVFFLIFYINRRKLIILPFARMMSQIFLEDNNEMEDSKKN